MARKDISATHLGSWDTYKNKPVDEALKLIYEHASKTSKSMCDWYWKSIKTKKKTSIYARFLTFLLLILGTVLPIIAGLQDKPEIRLQCTQLGVVALAIGGLLQVADRVFGWSSGWLRYITTVTAMENLSRKFELEWAGYLIVKPDPLNEADVKALFDVAKQFEDNMMKLQSDETDKWVSEFTSGVALLSDLIKSQRESGEKAIQEANAKIAAQRTEAEAKEKAKQNGALEITFRHKADPVAVNISIDDNPSEQFLGLIWSKVNLPPGQHILKIVLTGKLQETINKVVEIPSGGVARDTIQL
jgi:hypothetical protein